MFHDILQSQIGLGYYGDMATYGVVAMVIVLIGIFYLIPSRTFYSLPFSHAFPLSLSALIFPYNSPLKLCLLA